MLQLIRRLWQPRVSVVHFRRRSASYGATNLPSVPWWAETSGKGGNLLEAAELADAYAQIIKARKAESRAARRASQSSGQRAQISASSRFRQWLQGQTPRTGLRRTHVAQRVGGLLLLALFLCASGHAQGTYDWTLSDDPTFACSTCANVAGSGAFTVSPTLYSSIQGTGYPILSFTGTMNGAAVSLGTAPYTNGPTNLFYKSYLPVSWFAPLYFSTSQGMYVLTQSGDSHPGTGQFVTGPGINTPVAFSVTLAPDPAPPKPVPTPAPMPTPPTPTPPPVRPPFSINRPPPLVSTNHAPVTFQRTSTFTTPAITKRPALNPVVIEVSVPAAVALVAGIIEWEHHRHRERFDALPVGRY